MRHDQNALDVIYRVKQRIREIEPGLPRGLKITPICDRSDAVRELPTSEVPDESGRVFFVLAKGRTKSSDAFNWIQQGQLRRFPVSSHQ
jgi:hypothetical protein